MRNAMIAGNNRKNTCSNVENTVTTSANITPMQNAMFLKSIITSDHKAARQTAS